MKNIFRQSSIATIVKDLDEKEITQEEIYAIARSRFDIYNSIYKPFKCVLTFEQAKDEREESVPARYRPLNGIPFGIKDIFNTRTLPTEMGSDLWNGFIAGNNARCVESLQRSGAIPFGKTVTAEFAVHTLNETLNPYNIYRTPGTSSSGSAVAVALGIVPFAIGSQTAASIIRPASFCGVWGMKPSFGLIPRTGSLKTTDSLDTIGFFAFFGSDLKRLLSVMRVKGPDYPYVFKKIDSRGANPKDPSMPWKVGIFTSSFRSEAEFEVLDAFDIFIQRLSSTGHIHLRELADEFGTDIHANHEKIYDKSLWYYFQQEALDGEQVSCLMMEAIARGLTISACDYKLALKKQSEQQLLADMLYYDYDIILTLSTVTTAPMRHEIEKQDPSLIWTYLGMPSVNIPFSQSSSGLPIGLQIVSKRYDDYVLLQFAKYLIDLGLVSDSSLVLPLD